MDLPKDRNTSSGSDYIVSSGRLGYHERPRFCVWSSSVRFKFITRPNLTFSLSPGAVWNHDGCHKVNNMASTLTINTTLLCGKLFLKQKHRKVSRASFRFEEPSVIISLSYSVFIGTEAGKEKNRTWEQNLRSQEIIFWPLLRTQEMQFANFGVKLLSTSLAFHLNQDSTSSVMFVATFAVVFYFAVIIIVGHDAAILCDAGRKEWNNSFEEGSKELQHSMNLHHAKPAANRIIISGQLHFPVGSG